MTLPTSACAGCRLTPPTRACYSSTWPALPRKCPWTALQLLCSTLCPRRPSPGTAAASQPPTAEHPPQGRSHQRLQGLCRLPQALTLGPAQSQQQQQQQGPCHRAWQALHSHRQCLHSPQRPGRLQQGALGPKAKGPWLSQGVLGPKAEGPWLRGWLTWDPSLHLSSSLWPGCPALHCQGCGTPSCLVCPICW